MCEVLAIMLLEFWSDLSGFVIHLDDPGMQADAT